MNVAYIIFNRPDHTRQSFAKIREAKPDRLMVIADGPRTYVEGEEKKCREVRDYVLSHIDWECEVLTDFSKENLGCKYRVSSGIDWVFSQVEEAIILEDDCVPHIDFFRFCEEMLGHYREDDRVMHIGGANFINAFSSERVDYECSYYFSQYNHIWGWATWADSWQSHYEVEMKSWLNTHVRKRVKTYLSDPLEWKYWQAIFKRMAAGAEDTWDYQWHYAMWKEGGLAVIPSKNLIANVGFDEEATHTVNESVKANLPCESMEFPLRHPGAVEVAKLFDATTREKVFGIPNELKIRCLWQIKNSLPYKLLRDLKRRLCS